MSQPVINQIPSVPTSDITQLWNLGVDGVPLTQYLRWADEIGLFVLIADQEVASVEDVVSRTTLSERGAKAMLGVLCSLQVIKHEADGYRLMDIAREYLDRRGVFYAGRALYGMCKKRLPYGLQKRERVRKWSLINKSLWFWFRYIKKSALFWGRPERLLLQHSRNFPAAVVASQSKHFEGLQYLLDIGGGSGVFAIPLAIRNPNLRITLVDLPKVLSGVRLFLDGYSLGGRVELSGFDVYQSPWPFQGCDGILFGNFMHFCAEDECLKILEECFRLLPPGGRVILHEMLWNDNYDGPIVTALWNFWLTCRSGGGQRSRNEFSAMFTRAGFSEPVVEKTFGGFSLVVATKKA